MRLEPPPLRKPQIDYGVIRSRSRKDAWDASDRAGCSPPRRTGTPEGLAAAGRGRGAPVAGATRAGSDEELPAEKYHSHD